MTQMNKNLFLILFAFVMATTLFKPVQVKAFEIGQLIDPACFFACDNKNNRPQVIQVVTPPVVTYRNEVSKPVYVDNYNRPSNTSYDPLRVSCYPTPSSGNIGDNIIWYTTISGGNGGYSVDWSGSEGLSSSGTSVNKSYSYSGSKSASVTVRSAGQVVSQSCSNSVLIYDNRTNYNNDYYRNNDYYNNYNNNYYYNYNNNPLYVSCYADRTAVPTETIVNWTANATGGNGYYYYVWSGTDGISNYNRVNPVIYHNTGIKTATVTVTSGNQTVTQYCSNSVNVNQSYNQNYVYTYPYNNVAYVNPNSGIQVACYADKLSAKVGTPVIWSVKAVGATGNFNYTWSGSDGLVSNQTTAVKSYDSVGTKMAMVTATASNGQSLSQVCGNTVEITNYIASNNKKTNIAKSTKNNSNLLASVINLENIPWLTFAIVIIFMLFFTIIYLIFNKTKI